MSSIKAEEIRQAKKFIENKKVSIKDVKPRMFAIVAKHAKITFQELFDFLTKDINGTTNSSDKKTD